MKILYVMVSIMLLSGCAGVQVDMRGSWVGQPLIKLETHPEFGVPTERVTLSDGSLAYVYQFNGPLRSHYMAIGDSVISRSGQSQCLFTFYSAEKIITGIAWRGNCRVDKSRLPVL